LDVEDCLVRRQSVCQWDQLISHNTPSCLI